MKKSYVLFGAALLSAVVVTTAFSNMNVFGSEISTYDKTNMMVNNHTPAANPDGSQVSKSPITYHANKDKATQMKAVEEIKGFATDAELAKKGGKYAKKQLMTYREYIDTEKPDAFRPDIDPDRMIWLINSKFTKTFEIEGNTVEKANVTTIYDAETGELLGLTVTSDDPNGFKAATRQPASN